MTEQANNAAPTDNGTGVSVQSFEDRSAAAFGDAPAQTADATVTGASPSQTDSPAVSAEDAAKARRERLAKAAADMRASVDAKAQKREDAELRQRLAAAEKRAEEAERMRDQRIDISTLTEPQFFEYAAKAKVAPARLAEWLKEQSEHPELAAHRAAESAVAPKLTEWEKRIAAKEAELDQIIEHQRRSVVDAEEHAAFQEFAAFTASNAVTSPYSAAFLQRKGAGEFKKLALSAAARVPPGAGAQAVLDHIEENLSLLAEIYAPPGAPAKASNPHPIPGAAKPMTTVSNTLAQQRASVVDEDDSLSGLTFEERSARVFGRL